MIRIGSRGSRLARRQAALVRDKLARRWPEASFELVPIRTWGDEHRSAPIASLGPTVGIFVKELQEALLRGEIDVAVHSAKDLPTAETEGLVVAAFPDRADPRDALCSRWGGLQDLPRGARVGTSSPRRVGQLRIHRPDLVFRPLRGNVDTRLEKVRDGTFDAVVLALAGLLRSGLATSVSERLSPETCCPAPAQGALAVEVREGDTGTLRLAEVLDRPGVRWAVRAERAVLATLGGGCLLPLGALAEPEGDGFTLHAVLAGTRTPRLAVAQAHQEPGESPEDLGRRVAERILAAGGRDLLAEATAANGAADGTGDA